MSRKASWRSERWGEGAIGSSQEATAPGKANEGQGLVCVEELNSIPVVWEGFPEAVAPEKDRKGGTSSWGRWEEAINTEKT